MEDTVDKVAERLSRLEDTVAKGFYENSEQFKRIDARFTGIDARFTSIDARFTSIDARFNTIDQRLDALDRKIDISVESLRGDIKTVLETVVGFTEEMRRTSESIRREHAADREVLKLALLDHRQRIERLEDRSTSSSGQ